jgi:hypothetical protein
MMTEIISLVPMDLALLMVGIQALIWLIIELSWVPIIDPYIARAHRPPDRLKHFLHRINSTIDMIMDKMVPYLAGRTRRHRRSR